MRIGKPIKTVTSPKRNVKKYDERRKPEYYPVEIPKKTRKKVPEEVTAWKFNYGLVGWGISPITNRTIYLTAVS